MASASDPEILDFARETGRVCVTLDADFHALLAVTQAEQPSTIRIRIEGLNHQRGAMIIALVCERLSDELRTGAAVSITERTIRYRRLPVKPSD